MCDADSIEEGREERSGGFSVDLESVCLSVCQSVSQLEFVTWSLLVNPRPLLKFGSLYPCGALGVLLGSSAGLESKFYALRPVRPMCTLLAGYIGVY